MNMAGEGQLLGTSETYVHDWILWHQLVSVPACSTPQKSSQ